MSNLIKESGSKDSIKNEIKPEIECLIGHFAFIHSRSSVSMTTKAPQKTGHSMFLSFLLPKLSFAKAHGVTIQLVLEISLNSMCSATLLRRNRALFGLLCPDAESRHLPRGYSFEVFRFIDSLQMFF